MVHNALLSDAFGTSRIPPKRFSQYWPRHSAVTVSNYLGILSDSFCFFYENEVSYQKSYLRYTCILGPFLQNLLKLRRI